METVEQTADPSLRKLRTLLSQPTTSSFAAAIVLTNVFILLCRPQYSIPILATVGIPLLLNLPPLYVTARHAPKLWKKDKTSRAMFLMLALGAAWVPLARNNFWAFQTLRDLSQQFFCYLFPIVILLSFGGRLRKLVSCLSFCAVYLAIYSLLHDGKGPGGFLGDENDLCLQLDGLLGIPLLLLPVRHGLTAKLKSVVVSLIILGGIVATWSRGGFVGMMFVVGYMYLKTPYKVQSTVAGGAMLLIGLLCVPQSYWEEMGTISQTDEGTSKARMDMWKVGLSIWTDPKHFVFGTGMQNTPYYLGDYEPAENQTNRGKSWSGRAVHSSYVQMVADLGLAGLLLFITAIGGTLRLNNKIVRAIRGRKIQIGRYEALLGSSQPTSSGNPNEALLRTVRRAKTEVDYVAGFLLGINASILGALGAGTFVSAVYYPTFWLLVVLGITGRQYAKDISVALDEIASSPALLSRYALPAGEGL